MFARPPAAAALPAPDPSPAPDWRAWLAVLANPFVGAGAVAGLAILAVLVVSLTGDPHAGAPSVRVKLTGPSHSALKALRGEPTAPTVLEAVSADGALPGEAAFGQAVITLPQGGRVDGAAPGASPADAPAHPTGAPLPPAPFAGLTAPAPGGLLPVIGRDGRTPFAAYARPFAANGKPKIALVVGGLGLNATTTRAAIERLPPEVTLSFAPYTDGMQAWIDQARAFGHEVMIELPMEPTDYPQNDPGPHTLMAQGGGPESTRRLEWLLSRATGYFAVTNYLGGRFLASQTAVEGFVAQLKARGLGFLDDGSARGRGMAVPRASADAVVDQDLSAEAIAGQLKALEAQASSKGQALGAGFAYPVTVESAVRWTAGLAARGYQLAPASAMTRR